MRAVAFALVPALSLAGCAHPSGSTYEVGDVGRTIETAQGSVVSSRAVEISGERARGTPREERLRVMRIHGQRQGEVGDRPLVVVPGDHRDAPTIEYVRVGRSQCQRLRVVRDRAVQIALPGTSGAAIRIRGS